MCLEKLHLGKTLPEKFVAPCYMSCFSKDLLFFRFISDNLRFDQSRKQWGVSLDTGGVAVFHECYIDPAVPDTLSHRVRPCSGKTTISSCPENYTNATIRDLCHSYTALIFEPNTAYRNVHCAICHGADLEKLICLNLGPFGRNNWQQTFNTFSFAVLFDLSGEESNTVGFEKGPCLEGELYDPFFKKCRNVICGSSNQTYVNGKCVASKTTEEAVSVVSTPPETSTEQIVEYITTSIEDDQLTTTGDNEQNPNEVEIIVVGDEDEKESTSSTTSTTTTTTGN